jgi:MoxR-like ATPase
MEERQVTIEGETHRLAAPFFAMGTQNPIEYEGTYPLPEAQMDRFLLRLSTGYAETLERERLILARRIDWKKDDPTMDLKPVITAQQFRSLQKAVENDVYVDDVILRYIAEIVRKTREHPQVDVGSSPRGGLALLKASRAMALIRGRDFVTPDDVKTFVLDALSHRLILRLEHALEGVRERDIVKEIAGTVPVPKDFRPR